MLSLTRGFMGSQGIIHPTLLWDEQDAILVDAGEPGHRQQIVDGMNQAGVELQRLNRIILTHQDLDHIGGLPEIINNFSQKIEIIAHEADRPSIDGTQPLMKVKAIRDKLSLDDPKRNQLESLLTNPPKAHVDVTVEDGEVLPFLGGITVIHTPGHTPGHISLYINQSKILITGDAMVILDGKLQTPPAQFTPDMDTAVKSIRKFAQFDINTIICYHGGAITNQANQVLAELIQEL